MKRIKLLVILATLILGAATTSCQTTKPANYTTKADCEAAEVNCPSCPSGRQCVQLSNGTWHAQ